MRGARGTHHMTMTIERMMTAKVAEASADIAAAMCAAGGGRRGEPGHSKIEDVHFLRLKRGLGFYYFARPPLVAGAGRGKLVVPFSRNVSWAVFDTRRY